MPGGSDRGSCRTEESISVTPRLWGVSPWLLHRHCCPVTPPSCPAGNLGFPFNMSPFLTFHARHQVLWGHSLLTPPPPPQCIHSAATVRLLKCKHGCLPGGSAG
ncbi:hypothetical protein VULLAG_LOCUS1227 [Vulpes lagopus]